MFSMSATAPNSARKNKRPQITRGASKGSSSPGGGNVGGGEDSNTNHASTTICGGDSFVSPSKTKVVSKKKVDRSQTNSSPIHQKLLEETATIQNRASSPLPPVAPRRSVADTKSGQKIIASGVTSNNNDPDDYRDEESNGQRSNQDVENSNTTTSNDVESGTAKKIDAPNNSPILSKPSSRAMKQRNDLSAYMHDMDLLPDNNHLSPPKQDRCSPEMKKNILSLIEKDGQKQQQQDEGNVEFESGKTSPQSQHLTNDQGQHEHDEIILSETNDTSHQQDLEVCRKRLETEESSALSGNDLLNLPLGCTLSYDGNSGNVNTMNEVGAVDKERFSRSCSMEPMVEGTEDEEGLGIVKGEASIPHENNNAKSKSSPPPPPSSSSIEPEPQQQQQPKPSSPLIYRLYNNSPTSPMSEVHSTLMGGASKVAALEGSPCSSTGIAPSLFQENADDDIGGDTYFEGKLSPQPQPSSFSPVAENERRDSNDDEGAVDDFITPLPPPKVNRTKNNPMRCSSPSSKDSTTSPAAASSSMTTTSIDQLAGAPTLPIQSPRRQKFTPHTHSLLDDCSDDEENDDDEDEELSSSYVMVDTQSSTSRGIPSRRKRNNSHRSASISQQMANNNIQLALLQTRHRRWEIQSTFCGSHAQSNQVFDLSSRVHHVPKFHNRHQQHFSFSPIRPSSTAPDTDIDDDGVASLARLSVPIESVRAGALGSGLWRTVRLVKLPKGLFGWHWLMWKEQRQVPDSVYFGDNMPLDNEVWSLLQMLGETFPNLEQVDFGGDIAKTPATTTSREEQSVDSADTYNKEEWRNEILTCVMQCLPQLVAVDGFAVEMERCGDEDDPIKSYETQEASLDGSFGDVTLNANDERQEKAGRDGQVHTGVRTRVRCRTSSFTIPNQCDVATETSDAIEDVSENMMSLCTDYLSPHAHHREEKSVPTDHYGPIIESDEAKVAQSASSPLASSFSWGSAGSSGARPPPCPQSDSRRRLPSKPTIKSQMKSKLSKRNKRRLKKLTGLIPSMMDDEEDSDENESIDGDGAEECPEDLL